jgi:hypothetical protein
MAGLALGRSHRGRYTEIREAMAIRQFIDIPTSAGQKRRTGFAQNK